MTTNLFPLWVGLSRAYEIALLGGFSIRVMIDEDYTEGFDDFQKIKEFFKGVEFSADGDIVIQIEKPKTYNSKIIGETMADVLGRVEVAKGNKTPNRFESTTCDVLLNNATDKLNLSYNDRDMIIEFAKTIAQLEGSENIKAVHIAEGIQYIHFDGSLINVEGNYLTFGYGIRIARTRLRRGDITNAIKHLESLI